jgi:hypothetical protein
MSWVLFPGSLSAGCGGRLDAAVGWARRAAGWGPRGRRFFSGVIPQCDEQSGRTEFG